MKNTLPNEYKRREAEVQGNKSFQTALKNFNDVGKKVYELQQQGIHVPGQNLQRRGVVVLIERAIGVNWQNVMAFKNGVFLTVAVICVSMHCTMIVPKYDLSCKKMCFYFSNQV